MLGSTVASSTQNAELAKRNPNLNQPLTHLLRILAPLAPVLRGEGLGVRGKSAAPKSMNSMNQTISLCLVGFLLLGHSVQAQEGTAEVAPSPKLAQTGTSETIQPVETATGEIVTVEPATVGLVVVDEPAPEESTPTDDPATHEPVDDPNYQLLGEFAGDITLPGNSPKRVGLQVRPLGGDRFEARQYTGGLPGQDGFTGESQPLMGYRAGDSLILSGATWAVFVDHEQCRIIDREGNKLGELKRIVRTSPTIGAQPPAGAMVLFDGTNTDQFTSGEMTKDGWLLPGADIKPMFQDFNLHLEFKLPYMPDMTGQSRGNSGCYLLSRYEVQILDSFSEATTFNGCSSLYRQRPPDLNMCFPALQWQTYDIAFTAPRWASDGTKLHHARITVWQNGVKTQDNVQIENKTGAGKIEEPSLLPTRLQDHHDPVRFRNIWIIDRGLTPVAEFPVLSPK